MVLKQLDIHTQKNGSRHRPYILQKKWTWNVELNTKCKTVNLLGDSIEKNLDGLEQGDNFLDTMSEAQSVKK